MIQRHRFARRFRTQREEISEVQPHKTSRSATLREELQARRIRRERHAISEERSTLQENLAVLEGQAEDFLATIQEAKEYVPAMGRFAPENLNEVARLLKLLKGAIADPGGFLDTARETFELARNVAGPRMRPHSRLRSRDVLEEE